MKQDWLRKIYLQIFFCVLIFSYSLYYYIDRHNNTTELRLIIPALAKNVREFEAENQRLQYEIDCFESPLHLMELLRKPEFSYLKYPNKDEILVVPIGKKAYDGS